jgi:cytochrome P450
MIFFKVLLLSHTHLDEQFITVSMDLFLAGSETTSNTIEFAILYMILYPEVQKRVQAEIDAVIGNSRLPSIADKQK